MVGRLTAQTLLHAGALFLSLSGVVAGRGINKITVRPFSTIKPLPTPPTPPTPPIFPTIPTIPTTPTTPTLPTKNNVVVYYGQGPNQLPISNYCADPSIDIIVLSFVHLFPQQANGFPGTNFGNQCSLNTYPGPGYNGANNPANNHLLICPDLQRALNTCRKTSNKKILLSIGGGTDAYQLTGVADGLNFANLLWTMFGPPQAGSSAPRPFDYNGTSFAVDGFDFDIEHPSVDNSAGYKALVAQLRAYITQSRGTYYLTASPQCVVPDANEKDFIASTAFDMIFIQFYNTPQCSARTWANANPNYVPGGAVNTAGFTFDTWAAWLAGTASRNARLFIGLPGAASAAGTGSDVSVTQASNLASAYYCRPSFGGIAIWEATYASANIANGKNFYQNMKAALIADSQLACPTR